jgi:hypothetical protein
LYTYGIASFLLWLAGTEAPRQASIGIARIGEIGDSQELISGASYDYHAANILSQARFRRKMLVSTRTWSSASESGGMYTVVSRTCGPHLLIPLY